MIKCERLGRNRKEESNRMNVLYMLRSKKGLTLRQLADATGLHINTIHLIETGQNNARGKTLFKLAEFFECDVTVLEPLMNQVDNSPKTKAAA
jgi:transcriptional regulator with XRE-family HTH domain